MKRTLTLITLVTCCIALHAGPITLREKLEELNPYWKERNQVELPAIPVSELSETGIIQLHLCLVEKTLRNNFPKNFTKEQIVNRNRCLDLLHDYWTEGVFPKNLYHPKRTPYFIDKYGTACAVGQLIISTGNKDLAMKISSENNYDYIRTLKLKYPQINSWAGEYGFTTDELAWIQPAYPYCDTACNVTAAISTGFGQPPYSYLWNDGQTTQFATGLCPGRTYSCVVTDANGISIDPVNCDMSYSAVIIPGTNVISVPAVNPFYISLNSTLDYGSCNGTATAEVLEGVAPFSFYWTPGGQTYQTATGLCQGTYYVSVFDAIGCMKTDSVTVQSFTGLQELNQSSVFLYPNPAGKTLVIQTGRMFSENATITICNSLSQVVLVRKLNESLSEIDVSALESGTYFVSINDDWKGVRKHFFKN